MKYKILGEEISYTDFVAKVVSVIKNENCTDYGMVRKKLEGYGLTIESNSDVPFKDDTAICVIEVVAKNSEKLFGHKINSNLPVNKTKNQSITRTK